MFTIDQVIADHYPQLNEKRIFTPAVKYVLRRMLHEQAFIDFAEQYPHLQGIDLVEQVLEYFNFSCSISDRDRENIPTSGKVVIIANHPIGSLDGLALLKMIHEVRSDVKIVANDLLLAIEPLKSMLLPVRNMTGLSKKHYIQRINRALDNEEAIVLFPAGEVSRLGLKGVKDGAWQQGFMKIAERTKAPVLPVYIEGKNSPFFYLASTFAKPLSTVMLVGQMFYQNKRTIRMTIGSIIPYNSYANIQIRRKDKVKLFRKHVYRLGSGKKPLFETESAVARPERKTELKKEILQGEQIGKTPDGKIIILFQKVGSSPVLREIGRLREVTFRAVGEGTGKRRDLDHFDQYYQHLVLWDEDDLEIAGAYRFADAARVVSEKGMRGLYTWSLFNLDEKKCHFLKNSLELGRSFVQRKYWGKKSLDYLWYGIGAFLKQNPQYRYLFGPVSITNAMPQMAKELLIYFYKMYFTGSKDIRCSMNPFRFSLPQSVLGSGFSGTDYRSDFKKLKTQLNNLGTAIPPLYKQYTELCEPGGVTFLDFNIDPAFNNCIDGLVIVDTQMLKKKKRKRYLEESILS